MLEVLFEESFVVKSTSSVGFNKVTRITAYAENSEDIKITIDINTDLFPVKKDDTLAITLALSLGIESQMFTSNGSWRPPKGDMRSLLNDYDYIMYGVVYSFKEIPESNKLCVYISFGGLLMSLKANYRHLLNIKHENTYLLIRRY